MTKPTKAEAEAAIKTLLSYIGEDPNREGLVDTPSRVVKSFQEYYSGYETEPREILSKTFSEVEGYDEIIILRNII